MYKTEINMTNSPSDLYSLFWNNHTSNLKSAFDIFRCDNELVDVTLSCEGRKLKAHKIVLSACSLYFLDLFRDNPCQHPIIILRDVKYNILVHILNFMYQGEVNVDIQQLQVFLKTAEALQVKGLIEDESSKPLNTNEQQTKKAKQKNSMDTDSVVGDFISPLKKFKDNEIEFEPNDIDKDDDFMEETMEIVKTESESEDVIDNNSPDFLDLTLLTKVAHDHVQDIPINETKNVDSLQKSGLIAIDKIGFQCLYCGKVFSHSNSLKLHLLSHSGSTSCALCQAVLSRKYELKIHMRKKHNIELN